MDLPSHWQPIEPNNTYEVPETGFFIMLMIGPPGTGKFKMTWWLVCRGESLILSFFNSKPNFHHARFDVGFMRLTFGFKSICLKTVKMGGQRKAEKPHQNPIEISLWRVLPAPL
jgi:hypothetical protein